MCNIIITLRAARVNRGLTLVDVSRKTGKSVDTISRYEKDSSDIPRSLLVTLLDLYGIGADNIYFGRESDFTGKTA
jgi:transcriptional regulator with XRE-family HTH domain